MPEIRGYATHAAGAELLAYRYEVGELGADEVEVRISHCGICRSDLHLIDNDWQVSKFPFVPGHEIVGTVEAVGTAVQNLQPGERVGVGWQAGSCGTCAWCRQGKENLCPQAQPTCVHRNGGFADAVRVPARFVIPIPEALDSENAAPLLCAGITVYTPLRTYGVSPASRVGVVGIGGLGHLALQFARVFGAEVTAFSTSPAKEEEAHGDGRAPLLQYAREQGDEGARRLARSDRLHRECGPGLERLPELRCGRRECSAWSARRLARCRFPGSLLILSARTAQRQQYRQPVGAGRDAGRGRAPRCQGTDRALSHDRVNEAVAKVRKGAVRYRAVLAN